MKWDNVQITANDNKVYTGKGASEFVTNHCTSLQIRTTEDGLIEVYAGAFGATQNDREVRKYLFTKLLDKAKILKIITGNETARASLPLARAIKNIFNINPTKLKVEFIHKQYPKDSSPRRYLEDSKVTVTALLKGSDAPLTITADKGIADFGLVAPGEYTITADYPKSDECKYDWIEETLLATVKPESVEIVEFEVEPLYQKIQLIAHCLLAIPDRIYQPAAHEKLVANPAHANNPDKESPKKVVTADPNIIPPKDIAEDALKGKWKGKYHGKADDKKDMDARVSLVGALLDYARGKAKDDPTVLKVFMLPECFFQGLYGSYLIEDADHLFKQLLNLVGGAEWRDWMFVFGTVNFTFGEKVREMMNYSPVVRGGLGAASEATGSGGETDKQFRLIQKLVNSAELLNADELINQNGETRPPSVNQKVQFQGTENEGEVGEILFRLFDGTVLQNEEKKNYAKFGEGKKYDLIEWGKLKEQLRKEKQEETYPKFGKDKGFTLEQWKELYEALKKEDELKADFKFGESKGLEAEHWKQLQQALKSKAAELGTARVVRAIRKCSTKDTPDDLPGWGKFSGYKDRTLAHLEPESCVAATWEGLLLRFIREGWDAYYVAHPLVAKNPNVPPPLPPAFNAMRWKAAAAPGPERRTEILTGIQTRLEDLFTEFEIVLPYQKELLRGKIAEFINGDSAIAFVDAALGMTTKPAAIPEKFGAGIYPLWKKIFELYRAEKDYDEALLSQSIENLNYRDFCFAAARKAGPWLTFEEAEKLESCKKLIFGLEICADHANGRLCKLIQQPIPPSLPIGALEADRKNRETKRELLTRENLKKPKVTIDILLVASAGMIPTGDSIVARSGGFCFNCDGWNKGSDKGVNYITRWFEGPKVTFDNPVTPHTAIAKGGGVALDMDSFKPERIKLAEHIKPALCEDILNQTGLGELHVYKELDLPRN